MLTTPPAPVDLSTVHPRLAALARTTVRLHPRAGSPSADQSSLGGPLVWPADEPWPTCDGPAGGDHLDGEPGEEVVPLAPVLQLLASDVPELPFPPGTDVLQVLWCPFDHEPDSAPRPELRWRRLADIGPALAEMPAPDEETDPQLVPSPCVLHPERVVEYPADEVLGPLAEVIARIEQDTGWAYESELATATGTKALGHPDWIQSPDWPVCGCGAEMEHLLTVASWEFSRGDEKRWIATEDRPAMDGWGFDADDDHPWFALRNPAGLMLGDVGNVYLFVCTRCPERPSAHRFDCS